MANGLYNILSSHEMAAFASSLQCRSIRVRHWEMGHTRTINPPGAFLALKIGPLTQVNTMASQELTKSLSTHQKICLTAGKSEEWTVR